MEVYREVLPESYLLILADDVPPAQNRVDTLARALRRAVRSGKSSVWVDCSRLQHLPSNAADILTYYHRKLARLGMSLILCHLDHRLRTELEGTTAAPLLIMANLLDAEQYCHSRQAS